MQNKQSSACSNISVIEDELLSRNSSRLQRHENGTGVLQPVPEQKPDHANNTSVRGSSKRYMLVTRNMDWYAAIHFCRMLRTPTRRSHLIIIRNAEEKKAVSDYLRGQQLCSFILFCRKLDYMHLTYVICAFVMSCYSLI